MCTVINLLNFIYSEKATKFCEIFTLPLSCVVPVKSKVKISQNFVAFSEYMKFNYVINWICHFILNLIHLYKYDLILHVCNDAIFVFLCDIIVS